MLDKFNQFLKDKAKNLSLDHAFSGSYAGDPGGDLLNQIDIYEAGRKNIIPLQWKKYMDEFSKVTDPEYEKYLELKKKFGDV